MSEDNGKWIAAKVVEKIDFVEAGSEEIKFCYGIMCMETSRVKIGITDDWEKRFKTLQASSATKLELIHLAVTIGFELEGYIIRKFQRYRIHGEWFDFKGDEEGIKEMDKVFHNYLEASELPYLWWDDEKREEFNARESAKEAALQKEAA